MSETEIIQLDYEAGFVAISSRVNGICIGLSLTANGDVEVCLPLEAAQEITGLVLFCLGLRYAGGDPASYSNEAGSPTYAELVIGGVNEVGPWSIAVARRYGVLELSVRMAEGDDDRCVCAKLSDSDLTKVASATKKFLS